MKNEVINPINQSCKFSATMGFISSLLIVFVFFALSTNALPEEPHLTYYRLYELGKSAYTDERWYECTAFMRRSLEDYQFHRGILWNCHQRCDRHVTTDPFPLDTPAFREEKRAIYKRALPEARIFERVVKRALCIRRCKMDRLPGRPVEYPSAKVEEDFANLKPYSYMQFCYWKLGDLEHAVSAAYTYLIRNPGDTMMSENLQYYIKEKAYEEAMLKDLDQFEYQAAYLEGTNAYDEQRFMDVIDRMERSLEQFFEEIAKCRALCELSTPDDASVSTDFYSMVTESYIQVLKCRTSCHAHLTMIKGNRMDDFIPSHFHYLQFAYWKESMVRKAAEAVATYLLFYPEDETMLHNKRYYLENFALKPDHFTPRLDCVRYYKRLLLEQRMLDFLSEKFQFEEEEYPDAHPDDYRDISDDIPGLDDSEYIDQHGLQTKEFQSDAPEESLPPAPAPNRQKGDAANISEMEVASPFWTPSNEILREYESKHGVTVLKKETELNGRYRFLADQLLTKEECQALLDLAKLTEFGDGYNGKTSPHTKYEDFKGLTVARAAELAAESKASLESAKLLLDKSELGRSLVETYFNLTTHLYFDYTHLVCRSAKKSEDGKDTVLRSDLSHSIHGDNCLFRNGRCDRRSPAYTWRDYSAVIYLNDDFSGGEFIFSDKNKDIQAEIKPSCGQMVAFSGDTLHGVKAVTRGTRCVLALWMTLDPSHEEMDRIQAQQTLAKVELADADLQPPPLQAPSSSPSSGEL